MISLSKIKTYLILLVIFPLISNTSFAKGQDNSVLKQHADSLFRNNQFIKALKIYQSLTDTVSISTLDINIRIAMCYDYTTGVKNKGAVIKSKLELLPDTNSILYAKALLSYSSTLNSIGDHQKALELNTKAVDILNKNKELNYEWLAKAHIKQIEVYKSLADYDSALIAATVADSLLLQCKTLEYHLTQVPFLENFRATVYRYMGKYKEALQSANRSVQALQSINDTTSVLFARSISIRGTCHRNMGQQKLALLDLTKAIETIENTELKKSAMMAGLILNTGNVYYSIGDKNFALDHYLYAKKLREELGKDKEEGYGDVNLNIAILSFGEKKFTDANKSIKLAGEIYDLRNISKLSYKYALYQLYYALIDMENHNYTDALQKLNAAKQSFLKKGLTTNSTYYYLQSKLAHTNEALGNKKEALGIYKQVIDSLCKDQKITDPVVLNCFPKYIQLLNNQEQKEQYQLKYLSALSGYYFESLSQKSYQTQLNILKKLESDMNDCYSYLLNGNNSQKYVSKLYETTLLFKEFLTYQHKSFIKDFKGSNQQEYFNYLINKRVIYNHNSGEVTLDDKKLFAIKREIATFEEELRTTNKTEKEERITIVNEQKMAKDEAKIELFSFKNTISDKPTDDIIYGAFIVRSEWKSPKVSFLCTSMQYNKLIDQTIAKTLNSSPIEIFDQQLFNNLLYSSKNKENALYKLCWEPIDKHLSGISKIYLCSVGELNQVAINALPFNSDSLLFDKYKFEYPLSSKLITEFSHPLFYKDTMNTTLFGEMDYDLASFPPSKIQMAANTHNIINYRSANRGEKWEYLGNTEVIRVANIIKKNSGNVTLLTREKASEDAFYSLNGNSPQIIHFSTHAQYNELLEYHSSTTDTSWYEVSPNPLFRSFLVMSGANNEAGNIYNSNHDGKLTAYEVATTNLSNTKLAVLAACETGLGDAGNYEGVQGLRLAFKMAGVDYLLVSLWSVPNLQTTELMTQFYDQWINKSLEVREALRVSQKIMRNKYPDNPHFWAGFQLEY